MNNLGKYRKLSVIAMIIMVVTWLLALAALWNSLLTIEVKHEGWAVFFIILALVAGAFLFYFAYISTNSTRIEKMRKQAYESGRAEVLQEAENKKKSEGEQKLELEDTQKTVDAILAGIHNVRSENGLCNKLLISLAREMGFVQGIMYVKNKKEDTFNPSGEYALTERKPQPFKEGEGLPGQTASNKEMMVLYDVPENYFIISSGLGNSQPKFLVIIPVVHNNESIAVLELAAFKKPDESDSKIIDKVLSEVGHKLNKFISA